MLDRLPVVERNVVSLGVWMGCADFCRECSTSSTSSSSSSNAAFSSCASWWWPPLVVCSAASTAVSSLGRRGNMRGGRAGGRAGEGGETHHIARVAEDKDEGGFGAGSNAAAWGD